MIYYNYMNLPRKSGPNLANATNYSYLSGGMKTSATNTSSGEGLVYRGPMVYRQQANGTLTLDGVSFGEGRITPGGVRYHVCDHLGSVKAVVNGANGDIYTALDYDEYGAVSTSSTVSTVSAPAGETFRTRFTGQEDQGPVFGLPYTDFGARHYSPAIRRWLVPDPMSEDYYDISPYAYCADNPVGIVDENGDSLIVSNTGFILGRKGADNNVFYKNNENDLIHIGNLDGSVVIDDIYSNLLREDRIKARYMCPLTFYKLVRNKGDWDLKNNNMTIYGVANTLNTVFVFNGRDMSSQDVGNHHFGAAVASNVFIRKKTALWLAGEAQKLTGTSLPEWQKTRNIPIMVYSKSGLLSITYIKIPVAPYGDDPDDQFWIQEGFNYTE